MAKSRFSNRTKSLPIFNLCTAETLASCFLANLATSGTQAKSCGRCTTSATWSITLENSHVEPKNGGLEDDVPFQLGDL